MSIIIDLLQKVKTKRTKKDVHPNILAIQKKDKRKKALHRKVIIMSAVLLVFSAAGVVGLYYLNKLKELNSVELAKNMEIKRNFDLRDFPADENQKLEDEVSEMEQLNIPEADIIEKEGVDSEVDVNVDKELADIKKEIKQDRAIEKTTPLPTTIPADTHDKVPVKTEEQVVKNKPDAVKKTAPIVEILETDDSSQELFEEMRLKQIEIDGYIFRANYYEKKKMYRKAMKEYEKVLTIDPENFRILNKLSYDAMKIGNYKAAESYARRAANLNDTHVPAIVNLAISLSLLERYSEAEEMFQHALDLAPGNTGLLYNMGVFYEKNGKIDEAIFIYQQLSEKGHQKGRKAMLRLSNRLLH